MAFNVGSLFHAMGSSEYSFLGALGSADEWYVA
jgi:hypothetical protein